MLRACREPLWQPTPHRGVLARAVPALKANAPKIKGRKREAGWERDDMAGGEEQGHETRGWREQSTGEEEGKDSFFLAAIQVLVGPSAQPQAA